MKFYATFLYCDGTCPWITHAGYRAIELPSLPHVGDHVAIRSYLKPNTGEPQKIMDRVVVAARNVLLLGDLPCPIVLFGPVDTDGCYNLLAESYDREAIYFYEFSPEAMEGCQSNWIFCFPIRSYEQDMQMYDPSEQRAVLDPEELIADRIDKETRLQEMSLSASTDFFADLKATQVNLGEDDCDVDFLRISALLTDTICALHF